jgi:tetratricopeptide (TPR) repeat protein
LACFVGVCAVLAVGGHYLRGYQVRRNAGVLKQRAQEAAKAGRVEDTIKEYRLYLNLAPKDADAWAEYAFVLDDVAKTPRQRENVLYALETALRLNADRDDVRRRIVTVDMDLGRFADARVHLDVLLNRSHNADLLYQRGRCFEAEEKYEDAANEYEKAYQSDRKHVDSYVRLAGLLRYQLHNGKDTVELMAKMVKESDSFRAPLARARYYRLGGPGPDVGPQDFKPQDTDGADFKKLKETLREEVRPRPWGSEVVGAFTGGPVWTAFSGDGPKLLFQAQRDLAKALAAAPDDADVLLEAMALERALGRPGMARLHAANGEKAHPKDARMYQAQADLAGSRADAIASLKRGLKDENLPNEPALLFLLADLLIQDGKPDEAAEQIAKLTEQHANPAVLDYLDGRCLAASEQWLEAIKKLEAAYPALVRQPDLASQTALLLGQCYEQLGDPDQQYAAYRRVCRPEDTHAPFWFPASEGVARALLAMNKVDDALDAYRRLVPRAPAVQLTVIRLLIIRTMSKPEKDRDWGEVERLLGEAGRMFPKSMELAILNAHLMAARASELDPTLRGQAFSKARELLEAQTELDADVRVFLALAGLADSQGKPAECLAILDEAEKEFKESGDQLQLRLARARHYVQTADPDAVKLLGRLEQGTDRFSKTDRLALQRGLAEAYAAVDAPEQAWRLWKQVARVRPNDLGVQLRLFDLAQLMKHDEDVDDVLKAIRDIEGEKGTYWRFCAAARLISRAESGDKRGLEDARSLLRSVADRRPAWYRVPVAEARIDEISGKPDAAVRHYLRAIELGERSPQVLQTTARLLNEQGSDDEAFQLMGKIPEQVLLAQQTSPLVIDLSLRTGNTNDALKLALKARSENPTNYQNHLSLGRVYWALNDKDNAKASLRRAVELPSKTPEPWVTLVEFLAYTSSDPEKKEAKAAIAEMQSKPELAVEKHRLAYGRCRMAVDQFDQAKALYKAALAAAPRDPVVLRAAIGCLLRTGKDEDREDAKKYLDSLMALKDEAPREAESARVLKGFLVLSDGGDYKLTREELAKLRLLDPTPERAASDTVEDKRRRAMFLALQPRRHDREEAVRILVEEIAKDHPLAPGDRFLLAQLYKSLGQWRKAQNEMLELLGRGGNNRDYVAYFARCLLEKNEPEGAQPWVMKLKTLQPNAWRTVELEARLLAARKQGPEAAKLLLDFVMGKDARSPEVLQVGAVLEQIGRLDEAETIFKKVVSASDKPETVLVMAGFLSRRGQVSAALEVCDKARATCPVEKVYTVAVATLYQANSPKAEHLERVERWLDEALGGAQSDTARATALRRHRAAVCNLEGRTQDAVEVYRRCLEDDKRDTLSMNNLAWLLATQGRDLDQALRLVQQAIDVKGPLNNFLDTRGFVYLAKGDAQRAVDDLKEVITDNPNAVSYFHLAQAHYAAKSKDAAVDALQKAIELKIDDLKDKDLHPSERTKYKQLCEALIKR